MSEWSMIYIEDSKNIIYEKLCISFSLKIDFVLANSAGPDEMPHYNAAFHLGLPCLLKYPFRGF